VYTHARTTTQDTSTVGPEQKRKREAVCVPSSSLMRNFLESQLTVNGMGFQACLKIVSVVSHACSSHPHAASVVSQYWREGRGLAPRG
jgi:hypothetical protein